MPFTFKGRAYHRIESSTVPMPQSMYQQLLIDNRNLAGHWEIAPAVNVGINELDHKELFVMIEDGIRKGRIDQNARNESPENVLLRLGLLTDNAISNAAVVLFCKNPLPYYPQLLLRMARFQSTDKSTIIDSKQILGNAFTMLDEANKFLMRNLSIESVIKNESFYRDDIPEYSARAVREALINGISHRDYSIPGGSISLFIYSDRLEVTSHGNLPLNMPIEILKTPHESQPRNQIIANIFYRRGLVESMGTGTQEIVRKSLEIGSPEPEFLEYANTFIVRMFNRSSQDTQTMQIHDLSDRQHEILQLLDKDNYSIKEIIVALKNPPAERTLQDDLTKLKSLGLVDTVGAGRATTWSKKA